MRSFATALATCALLTLGAALAQQNDPVAVTLETFLVIADGQTIPITRATPGDTIEYRLTATNVGDTTLPAGRVVLTLPVPEGGSYEHGSATRGPTIDRVYADAGGTYNFAFTTTTDHIRWTYIGALAPNASFQVAARFRIGEQTPNPRDGGARAAAALRRDFEPFVDAMFGHLGITRFACTPQAGRSTACGDATLDERIFMRTWDLYAGSAAELPVRPPRPTSAWQRDDDGYPYRTYEYAGGTLYVAYGDGFVYLAW